jgi:predicted GNAT family acetyltransferase
MNLSRFPAAHDFRARAEAFLLEREAEHNLPLGLVSALTFNPDLYGTQPYFAVVEDAEASRASGVIAAALMTPPYRLVLSLVEDQEALVRIAHDVREFRPDTPGVTGPVPVSLQFAEIWRALTGRSFRRSMAERIYRLEKVRPPSGVSGHMRRAAEADRALLIEWVTAFQQEAFGEPDPAAVERMAHNMLVMPPEMRGTYLWEDSHPVSLVSYGGPTPNSMRLGPVYTPPESRRKGYASACTVGVSQYLLDSGRKFCTLFTDLANPTSNHIYQAIGYEPVCDVDEYKFIE